MNKNSIALLGILAALSVATYLLLQRPGEQSVSSSEGEPLVQVDSAAVDKIEIMSPGSSVTLAKRGAEWFLEKPLAARADQKAVRTLLQQSKNLSVKAVVSNKPEKQTLFEVDSAGTHVVLSGAGVLQASVVLGKMGPSYSDIYARLASSNDVVLVDASLSYSAKRSLKDWRDRTIVAAPKETIKEIQYQYGDTTFALTWRDSLWMIGREKADDATVNSLLGSLAQFETDEFIDSLPKPSPKLLAAVSYAGVQLRFSRGKTGSAYFVQTSSSPQIFELQDWHANQVLKRKKDLIKAHP